MNQLYEPIQGVKKKAKLKRWCKRCGNKFTNTGVKVMLCDECAKKALKKRRFAIRRGLKNAKNKMSSM